MSMSSMFIVLILLLSSDLRAQDSIATLSLIHRLEGRWRTDVAGRKPSILTTQIEAWRTMPDGSMVGWSGTAVGIGIRKDEDLAISYRDGQLTYSATVMRQNNSRPIAFTCTMATQRAMCFENAAHEFPQKIEYVFITPDSIVVTVSGKERTFSVKYRRIPLHAYAYTNVKNDEKGHFATELPAPTDPRPPIERLLGRWKFDTTDLRLRLVKKHKNRFEGSLTITAGDLKTYVNNSLIIEKLGPTWTLTMQRRGWNHDQPAVYTLEHGSANTLIFQCHYGESPNSLHIEFVNDNTIWLSCADIIGVGGEHGGQGLQYDREAPR